MKRYYLEQGNGTITIMEINHDNRVDFWKDHPNAKEISKEEFDNIMSLAEKPSYLFKEVNS